MHVLSVRFYEFTSACLRCREAVALTAESQQAPSLWTAAIGPLEYVGLRLKDHIRDVSMGDQVRLLILIVYVFDFTYLPMVTVSLTLTLTFSVFLNLIAACS